MGKLPYKEKLRMQTLLEQEFGTKAIISSYHDKRWKLNIVKKVCRRVDRTGSAVLCKPGSGTRRLATVSACAVCRCKTIFPLVSPTKL